MRQKTGSAAELNECKYGVKGIALWLVPPDWQSVRPGFYPTQTPHAAAGESNVGRVADPVHFWPDPDPANQNFKNRIRILESGSYWHLPRINSNI